MVDDLTTSDLSPVELAQRHRLPSNLVAHHLGVLKHSGLIERSRSSGDQRRRYIRLRLDTLAEIREWLADLETCSDQRRRCGVRRPAR